MAESGERWEELEAHGEAGEAIALPISVGPPTGYKWEIELPPGVERLTDAPGVEPEAAVRLGSGRGGALRVRAPRGEHVIAARLVRPWEPDQPIRQVRIRVHCR